MYDLIIMFSHPTLFYLSVVLYVHYDLQIYLLTDNVKIFD